MSMYNNWKVKNPAANDKQVANVEFVLKEIDRISIDGSQIEGSIDGSRITNIYGNQIQGHISNATIGGSQITETIDGSRIRNIGGNQIEGHISNATIGGSQITDSIDGSRIRNIGGDQIQGHISNATIGGSQIEGSIDGSRITNIYGNQIQGAIYQNINGSGNGNPLQFDIQPTQSVITGSFSGSIARHRLVMYDGSNNILGTITLAQLKAMLT